MGKCCCIVLVVIAAVVILGVVIGVPVSVKKAKDNVKNWDDSALGGACNQTSYPSTCNETFTGDHPRDSNGVTRFSVQRSQAGVNNTMVDVNSLNSADANISAAQAVCSETLQSAIEELQNAAAALNTVKTVDATTLANVKTWVSAAMEMHTTCIDAFKEIQPTTGLALEQRSAHTDQLMSNALAFINALSEYGTDLLAWRPSGFSLPEGFDWNDLPKVTLPKIPGFGNRRLLSTVDDVVDDGFPKWMDTTTRRHLLQTTPKYDVMVAKDGSGKYTTIQAAVDAYKVNTKRVVIYIKTGIYNEQVIVPKKAQSLTLVGDGDTTVITGSRNVALMPGMTTYLSATLIVQGNNFVGKSFKVENTAGAAGHQAVAFRGSADMISMYKVTFDSFQDTLYSHSFRQYYRECTVQGTVDFIFGNSNAAFQNCSIIAKKTTLIGQQNTFTAQGRTDPHQNTGLSFQNSVFDGTAALKSSSTALYKTYLGRPWKQYSVCVIMTSQIAAVVDPTGWLPWNTSSFGLYTSYFAEYQNNGPGSLLTNRVTWSHTVKDAKTANSYQANNFVQASNWAPAAGVPVTQTL